MTHKPDGWHTLTPRIFAEDAKGLVAFLGTTFGATGEYDGERPAELRIGDSVLMVSEAGVRPATPACLYAYVEDVDGTYQRAVAAGAASLEEPHLTPYGDRRAMFEDAWGNLWQVARRLPAGEA